MLCPLHSNFYIPVVCNHALRVTYGNSCSHVECSASSPPPPPHSSPSPYPFLHCLIIIILILSMYCPRNTLLTHLVTNHMMGHHNVYAVHHGLFHWSLIYSKSASSVCHMLSEFCCLVALCCIVSACPFLFPHQHFHRAYMQPCMTLNCFFFLSTYITENMVTEATMVTRV